MFPDADIPVLQISMPSLDPQQLLVTGQRLAPLRDEGVLIIGSGFFTHNLSAIRSVTRSDGIPPAWSSEFDHWGDETLRSGDLDALLDFQRKAPAAALAHPADQTLRATVRLARREHRRRQIGNHDRRLLVRYGETFPAARLAAT
jgi:aromatic ring-opening dioxygenase catalytic subunit (LigB family)